MFVLSKDMVPFMSRFVLSFLGYGDGYTDAVSMMIAGSCSADFAQKLAFWMKCSYFIGVVFLFVRPLVAPGRQGIAAVFFSGPLGYRFESEIFVPLTPLIFLPSLSACERCYWLLTCAVGNTSS